MKKCTPFLFRARLSWLLLLACCWSLAVQAQQSRDISGKITGETGDGLPGVTVLVKGTNTGTTTDPNCSFSFYVRYCVL